MKDLISCVFIWKVPHSSVDWWNMAMHTWHRSYQWHWLSSRLSKIQKPPREGVYILSFEQSAHGVYFQAKLFNKTDLWPGSNLGHDLCHTWHKIIGSSGRSLGGSRVISPCLGKNKQINNIKTKTYYYQWCSNSTLRSVSFGRLQKKSFSPKTTVAQQEEVRGKDNINNNIPILLYIRKCRQIKRKIKTKEDEISLKAVDNIGITQNNYQHKTLLGNE